MAGKKGAARRFFYVVRDRLGVMRVALFGIFSLVAVHALADASDLRSLANDTAWKKLLHYESQALSPDRYRSAIHSRDFFISPDGETDPAAELSATLEAMLKAADDSHDMHAKCRFPARLLWLQKKFPEHRARLANIDCPEFNNWIRLDDIGSISVVFANGYFDNPASYYGHLFLKFNNKKGSHLTDQTANYGAVNTSNDDPVTYIVKGISGGYDGGFSPIDFFFHDGNYSDSEFRDLWEYRLNLTAEDVRYVISHIWEILQKRFTYYFFHDNCAYRVGEILGLIDGLEVNPKRRPWIVPQAILHNLKDAPSPQSPLVREILFHPSRQTRLYEKYAKLNSRQRALATDVAHRNIRIGAPEIGKLPLPEQYALIDTVIDYELFVNKRRKAGNEQLSQEYVDALKARLSLPPAPPAISQSPERLAPSSGNLPSWIQIGAGITDHSHSAFVRIRPAHYDVLDGGGALANNSALSMGDLTLEMRQDAARLIRLWLISVDSANPSSTGLPGDRGIGWRLKVGGEEDRVGCSRCFVAKMQGDYSLSAWAMPSLLFASVYAGGALQQKTDLNHFGFARVGAAMLSRPSADFGMRASAEYRQPADFRGRGYSYRAVEARYAFAKDMDLRLSGERDLATRINVGVGLYW